MNTIKSVVLLGAMTGLLMFIGGLFGGKGGVVIAFFFAVVMNFGAYWFSDKIVLRMYNAQEVTEHQAPEIYTLVRNLVLKASMPMPKVYIIPEDTPNAFATGRNESHAVVAVTEGILRILSREDLGQPLRPGRRPGEAVPGLPGDADGCESLDGAPLHRQSADRTRLHESLQHPSAYRRARCPTEKHETQIDK
jgi:hypothetical protein